MLAVLLGGCSLHRSAPAPAESLPNHFQRADSSAAPYLVRDPQRAALWKQPIIQGWIHKGLTHNPSLQAALSSLQAAHEQTLAQQASLLPDLSAGYSGQRATVSNALSSPLQVPASPYTLHTAQVSVSYVPDVFGLNHEMLYSLQAQEALNAAQYDAARLALANTITATAIQLAWAEDASTLTQQMLADTHQLTQMIQQGMILGFNTRMDLLQQEQQEQQTAAQIPLWNKQKEQSLDALAVLTGQTPDQLHAKTIHLSDLIDTATPSLTLPASWVRQRPDIRAAEAQVHSAAAGLGIAIASRWPQFSLTAAWGGESTLLSRTLSPADRFWSLGAGITQPIFDFGVLKHRQKAAQATLQETESQYHMTVLQGLQNVADSLYALQTDEQSLQQARLQAKAAADLLASSQHRVDSGLTSGIDLLQNGILGLQAQLNQLQWEASRLQDLVALRLALGSKVTDDNGAAQAQPRDQKPDRD